MSFLYPRTVSIFRPKRSNAVGAVPYKGLTPSNDDQLYCDLPAGVQWRASIGRPPTNIPSDAAVQGYWEVLIPLGNGITFGSVRDRDVIVDDQGIRYQVFGDYHTPLNSQFKCQRLEA